MNDTVKIFCENTGANLFVNQGTSLLQVAQMLSLEKGNDTPLLAAYVDNRLKELSYRIYSPLTVRFIDITHFEGMRVYQRTLFFILDKAVCDLFPDRKLHIKHAVAKGFYCEIEGMEDIPGNRNRPDQRAYAGHHRTEHSDRASARDLRRGRGDVPPNGTRRQDRPTRHASAPVRHPLQDGRHRRLFLRGTRHFDRIHPPVRPAQIL